MSINLELYRFERLVLPMLALCLVSVSASCTSTSADTKTANVIIQGGTVYNGTDTPPVIEDVVISGDRIVYVGADASKKYKSKRIINAKGKIVSPGFIDAHAHPGKYIKSEDPKQRFNSPWLFQGVTTLMIGVDGNGTPYIDKKAHLFKRNGIGTNVAPYVGFGAIRRKILGMADRAPSKTELKKMEKLVATGMCEGAFGFSTGLFYAPQSYAKTDEVIALAREAAIRGGIYDTHQRDESDYTIGLLASIKEAIQIGREAGLPTTISHIKALGVDVQGMAPKVVKIIDSARAHGLKVTANQYPWLASATSLGAALLPRWAVAGGQKKFISRMDNPEEKARIRDETKNNLRRRGGSRSLLLITAGQPWTGKTLKQLSENWGMTPVEAAFKLFRTKGWDNTRVASFNMSESDVETFMKQKWVITSSDGVDGHPREYATYPEKYTKYVKKLHVINMLRFIRNSTGHSADILGLEKRGYIKPGYYADVVVFDPKKYAPRATYLHPYKLSVGVSELLVNGVFVIHDGNPTWKLPGRTLRHNPTPGTCDKI